MHDSATGVSEVDGRAENGKEGWFSAQLCLSLAPVPQLLWTSKERDCVQSRRTSTSYHTSTALNCFACDRAIECNWSRQRWHPWVSPHTVTHKRGQPATCPKMHYIFDYKNKPWGKCVFVRLFILYTFFLGRWRGVMTRKRSKIPVMTRGEKHYKKTTTGRHICTYWGVDVYFSCRQYLCGRTVPACNANIKITTILRAFWLARLPC